MEDSKDKLENQIDKIKNAQKPEALLNKVINSFDDTKSKMEIIRSDKIQKDKENKEKEDKEREKLKDKLEKDSENKKPDKEILKKWYGHIKKLKIELFLIDSLIEPNCKFCIVWKSDQNKRQRELFFKFWELIGLSEDVVMIREIPCDWNALHGEEFIRSDGIIGYYPPDLTENGENYFFAYGLDIERFPSLRVMIETNKEDKEGNKEIEIIFQGLGIKKMQKVEFSFDGIKYQQDQEVIEIEILKPLLRFLRTLDEEYAEFSLHDKDDLALAQYHRQGD